MKRYRLILLMLALLVPASLACEFLDSIQQDPSLVVNPDLSDEQREATQAAGVETLNAEFDLTQTATVRDQAATQTANALSAATATADSLRTFSTIEAEFTATAAIALTATALARPNLPPVITRFTANFVSADRTTYYDVEATDPDGDTSKLKYEWSNTNKCGAFSWDEEAKLDPSADWYHPHPPCPDERFHPATITVIVSDDVGGQAVYEYTGGSASATILLTPAP